jgi:hypothetical protein
MRDNNEGLRILLCRWKISPSDESTVASALPGGPSYHPSLLQQHQQAAAQSRNYRTELQHGPFVGALAVQPQISATSTRMTTCQATARRDSQTASNSVSSGNQIQDATVRAVVEEANETKNDEGESSKQRMVFSLALVVGLLLVVAVTLVLVFVAPWNDAASSPKSREQALKKFQKNLPNFTQQELLDPTSPQSQALAFLEEIMQKQNDKLLVSWDLTEEWKLRQIFAVATLYIARYQTLPEQGILLYENNDECEWFDHSDRLRPTCHYLTKRYQHLKFSWGAQESAIPKEISLLSELTSLTILPGTTASSPPNTTSASSTTTTTTTTTLEDVLPSELGLLEHLSEVVMSTINIQGSIPSYIFTIFTNLETIDWSYNNLTGSLPSDLFVKLTSLSHLTLQNNSLTGSLPADWSGMTNLLTLRLDDNQLTGTIPPQLGPQVASSTGGLLPFGFGTYTLSLGGNSLTGTLPSELGLLTSMYEFRVSHNHDLTGVIPNELASWEGTLFILDLDGTSLEGTIPHALFCRTQIRFSLDCEKVQCNTC